MRKINLIWDFRGNDPLETAKHHCIHLEEFAKMENLPYHTVFHESINEMWCTAVIVVNENDMIIFRDALKPHRATLAA